MTDRQVTLLHVFYPDHEVDAETFVFDYDITGDEAKSFVDEYIAECVASDPDECNYVPEYTIRLERQTVLSRR